MNTRHLAGLEWAIGDVMHTQSTPGLQEARARQRRQPAEPIGYMFQAWLIGGHAQRMKPGAR